MSAKWWMLGIALKYQHRQVIVITPGTDSSIETIQKMIERWKAGEIVEGITASYEGGEVDTICVCDKATGRPGRLQGC